MARLKPLPPTMREKKRYLAFEIISEKDAYPDFKSSSKYMLDSIFSFMGESSASRAGIWMLPDKFKDGKGIIRVNNKYVNELKVALSHIQKIDNTEVIVRSLGVSGILKKAMSRYVAS